MMGIRPRSLFALGVLFLLGTGSVGCGRSDRPMVSVSGVATYGGGPWPFLPSITLMPYETYGSLPNRPGSARGELNGEFVVSSFKDGDGLQPGKYHVRISCLDPMDFTRPEEEIEFVPQDFRAEDLEVKPGQDPIVLTYNVPVKNPLPKMRKNPNNWTPPSRR